MLYQNNNLCCQQVIKTNSFRSHRARQTLKKSHQLNCENCGPIYVIQCQIYHPRAKRAKRVSLRAKRVGRYCVLPDETPHHLHMHSKIPQTRLFYIIFGSIRYIAVSCFANISWLKV